MTLRTLKQTDLKVSRLCLGTMTFGKPVDQAEANEMIAACIDAGVNFIDTANMYQLGQAEEMVGTALLGKRDQIILASKVRTKMGEGPDESGLSKRAILRAVEDSLRRLRTDYLDLYFLHMPDHNVPIAESLEAMEQLVKQGKVRYPATSNYAGWEVVQNLEIARRNGYTPAATAQPMYNLLARGIEQEFIAMTKEYNVSIIAYNPLAGGLLTGKHVFSSAPAAGRFDKNALYQDRYWHGRMFEAVERLKGLAEAAGRSLIGLAYAWLLHHTVTDCVIMGASKIEQLKQNLALAQEGPLAEETVRACDQVWAELRGPLPVYNR